jgi:D-3-phosphoglycerate dehydrogenase / 2-oxoglutarate reductase
MAILISEELDAPALQRLAERHSVLRDGTLWADPARLKAAIAKARVIVVRNQTRVTAEILEAAPGLIAVARAGVGLDNIDLETARRRNIAVLSPVEANAVSVAELTLALMLALARKIPRADRSTKSGGWDRKGCTGTELAGKTIALCGFGRIGRRVAGLCRAFGIHVLVFDPFLKPSGSGIEAGVEWCGAIEEALGRADFVSVHCPLTPDTKGMFNARTFAAMKRGAAFINTSRGGLVDESALLASLHSAQVGAAALDVREAEPPRTGDLETMDNVILTPHIGAFTHEAQNRTMEMLAADIDLMLRGETPLCRVA